MMDEVVFMLGTQYLKKGREIQTVIRRIQTLKVCEETMITGYETLNT